MVYPVAGMYFNTENLSFQSYIELYAENFSSLCSSATHKHCVENLYLLGFMN